MLLDADSWWALEARGLRGADISYLGEVRRAHATLWRAGIVCDLARPDAGLAGYRLVLAPALYLLTDEAAASLRDYVDGGGQLVVTFGSGIVDPAHQVRLGGYPGALRDLLGIRVEEFFPLPAADRVPLSTGEAGTLWSELVRAAGAEVLARYAAGPLAGQPAITRNRAGAGRAWYLSTRLEDAALDRVIGEAAAAAGLAPVLPGLRPGWRRRGGTARPASPGCSC